MENEKLRHRAMTIVRLSIPKNRQLIDLLSLGNHVKLSVSVGENHFCDFGIIVHLAKVDGNEALAILCKNDRGYV